MRSYRLFDPDEKLITSLNEFFRQVMVFRFWICITTMYVMSIENIKVKVQFQIFSVLFQQNSDNVVLFWWIFVHEKAIVQNYSKTSKIQFNTYNLSNSIKKMQIARPSPSFKRGPSLMSTHAPQPFLTVPTAYNFQSIYNP